jgi:hypothetical protein
MVGAKTYNMPGPSYHGKFPTLHVFARAQLDAVLTEPLPEEWKDLLRQIDEQEEHQASRSDPPSGDIHNKKTNM